MPQVAERTCSNCVYYYYDEVTEDIYCLRYPPTNTAEWPETTADAWCGEWGPNFKSALIPGAV